MGLVGASPVLGSGRVTVEVAVVSTEPDGTLALKRRDPLAYPDSSECRDGDAGSHHSQGHDHEGGRVSGRAVDVEALRKVRYLESEPVVGAVGEEQAAGHHGGPNCGI